MTFGFGGKYMIARILEFLVKWNVPKEYRQLVAYLILSAAILLACILIELFLRWIVIELYYLITSRSKRLIPPLIKRTKLFERFAHVSTPIFISFFASSYGDDAEGWIQKGLTIYVLIVLIAILNSSFAVVDDVYRTHEISKKRPIKAFLQIVELIVVILFMIFIIASWIHESPLVLLSGFGAFAAILSLIFKDTLLGFVSGIQLSFNDMVRIGDWIEMPKYFVDGTVSDITLISVEIENSDNTTTTVPAYALVSDSFKNWRGMIQSGSRRLKRAVFIDMTSITFCTEEMLDRFSKYEYLSTYIAGKRKEFAKAAGKSPLQTEIKSSRQKLTNIGVFRIYLEKYLAHNPKIHEDMTILVRQLPADSKGLPLEIYAFATETDWISYENIQSDIFDHIYAIAPSFGLRLFQEPSGHDMSSISMSGS